MMTDAGVFIFSCDVEGCPSVIEIADCDHVHEAKGYLTSYGWSAARNGSDRVYCDKHGFHLQKRHFNEFAGAFYAMQEGAHAVATQSGFWDSPNDFGTFAALLHEEISEAFSAWREGNLPDDKIPSYSSIEVELADIIIRIMDSAEHQGWDIPGAIWHKIHYNQSRPYKHGKRC